MVGALIAALRPILIVTLVGGAATAVIAPAFDMAAQHRTSHAQSGGTAPLRHDPAPTPHPDDDPSDEPEMDFETLVRMCFETHDPDSDACAAAALKSGLSYEAFRAKIAAKLEAEKKPEVAKDEPKPEPTKKVEPVAVKKPEPKNDFATWFEKCLATKNFDSDDCIHAEELSGLSTADFEAKFKAKLAAKDGSDFWAMFEKCLDTRSWRSDACIRAQELIGFNDEDFHAKFDRYLAERDAKTAKAAKDGNDFWAWFEKCLATRDVHSDPCFRAQQLIGYGDADFQAKFDRYLAERDAKQVKPTPKPTPKLTPKPVVNLDAYFQACGATHEWDSSACAEALVRSQLSTADFRAKMTAKFGTFH